MIRRAYAGALRRLDAWLDDRELHDVTLAAYLAELHDAGRASASASMAVAAACFRAKLAGQPAPAGERTARVLAGYRRTDWRARAWPGAAVRGLGLGRCARHLPPAAAARAWCRVRPGCPRASRCGDRGPALFMAGTDVADSTDGDGMLVTVRRSKTNQEGEGKRHAVREGRRRTGPPHAARGSGTFEHVQGCAIACLVGRFTRILYAIWGHPFPSFERFS